MKVRTALVGLGIGAMVLTACGGPAKASGSFDETKYKASVKAVKEISHTVKVKEKKTKSVCTRKVNGVCKSHRTVSDGFKLVDKKVIDKHGKPGKPAKYCVELDNVNGKSDQDDVWFTVSHVTYLKYFGKDEGVPVKDMEYNHKGC
jgi:hypothetical protein